MMRPTMVATRCNVLHGGCRYLQDVQCSLLQESKGYRLTFTFAENEYFANKELTKTCVRRAPPLMTPPHTSNVLLWREERRRLGLLT
jgi:hypothetical protein